MILIGRLALSSSHLVPMDSGGAAAMAAALLNLKLLLLRVQKKRRCDYVAFDGFAYRRETLDFKMARGEIHFWQIFFCCSARRCFDQLNQNVRVCGRGRKVINK